MTSDYDVIVVGGGFAGVTAARELTRDGRRVLLLEARDRLGGRTWTADWHGQPVEYGGGWVHWHQPHTWSEVMRAGLEVNLSPDAERVGWWVGNDRRSGTVAQRDGIAERGWNQFIAGADVALPNPYDPLGVGEAFLRFDRQSMAERVDELSLSEEERAVLVAELESVAQAPLDEAGAAAILRWHVLSGSTLQLTQYTGGRVTLRQGTKSLLMAIADGAVYERELNSPVAAIEDDSAGVTVTARDGRAWRARAVVVAVPLNTLDQISFDRPLADDKATAIGVGQAARGLKIFLRARGSAVMENTIRPGHAFGYLDTEWVLGDGSQIMIGFGIDAARVDVSDLRSVQSQLDQIIPGLEVVDATLHNWVEDEFSKGTWAIHRPGWYSQHHAAMRRIDGHVVFAGSDVADGWSGFIDGAIESGLRSRRQVASIID